ncbi:toll/interleukin-1 receptor domain-containing protein [Denitromonas halophila]|uniref:Toll/interleukin-1 receptor domain-containing protein n=1 Tax=Denitromonas halophila TaxID=1629404 RepID=A0A557R0T8_9RHOO|nr:toll/interleukin-1 receptor domain-containing protein [Denitromonas halophila]TVO58778.1 toll/interleukin-1 receptor domain-containing protein [Denitromonas halophila]
MKGIFVSYRRQDSQSAAGRLSDHLRDHLSGVPIFRDVETIEPGVDFVEAIERALASCGVLVAVIGPRWLTVSNDNGQRRLDDPDDYTRIEIATALKRDGVRVIPVLVEGAQMPGSDALPDDLASLARRNAMELTDRRWDYDVSQLVDTLRKVLDLAAPEPEPPPAPVVAARGGGSNGRSSGCWGWA